MSFSIPMHESYMPNVFLEVPGRWLDTYESFRPPEFFTYWRTLTGSTQYDQRREGLGSLWYMHTDQDPTPNANLVNAAALLACWVHPTALPRPSSWAGRCWVNKAFSASTTIPKPSPWPMGLGAGRVPPPTLRLHG